MEGKKKVGSSSSSSSLTSELFGSRENSPSSSSSGIFGSIFTTPSKTLGRESLRPETMTGGWSKPVDYSDEAWNSKAADTGGTGRTREQEDLGVANQDSGSIYQEQRVQQPCHLSSSIYYGGRQDDYAQPQSVSGSSVNSAYKKDWGEDDSGSASRGNWWQGSLYY